MARRTTSRRLTQGQRLEQAARIDKLQLDKLRADFPEELREICNLSPLRSKQNLDDFLLELDKITYFGRRRADKAYRESIVQSTFPLRKPCVGTDRPLGIHYCDTVERRLAALADQAGTNSKEIGHWFRQTAKNNDETTIYGIHSTRIAYD